MGGLALSATLATTNTILSHLRLQSQNLKVGVAVLPVEKSFYQSQNVQGEIVAAHRLS